MGIVYNKVLPSGDDAAVILPNNIVFVLGTLVTIEREDDAMTIPPKRALRRERSAS